jgi:hypothetical protein
MSESQEKKQNRLAARDLLIRAGRLDSRKDLVPTPLPILIEQSGGPAENMLLRISDVMIGCYIYLTCVTDAPRIQVREVRLELPIPKFDVYWLQENCRHERNYWLGRDFCLPDDLVLNHRIPGMLYRGRAHEGWLVGLIQQSLPLARGTVTGKLILSDALGRSASADVSLMIDPIILKKTVQKPRKGLFELNEMESAKARVKGSPA